MRIVLQKDFRPFVYRVAAIGDLISINKFHHSKSGRDLYKVPNAPVDLTIFLKMDFINSILFQIIVSDRVFYPCMKMVFCYQNCSVLL